MPHPQIDDTRLRPELHRALEANDILPAMVTGKLTYETEGTTILVFEEGHDDPIARVPIHRVRKADIMAVLIAFAEVAQAENPALLKLDVSDAQVVEPARSDYVAVYVGGEHLATIPRSEVVPGWPADDIAPRDGDPLAPEIPG